MEAAFVAILVVLLAFALGLDTGRKHTKSDYNAGRSDGIRLGISFVVKTLFDVLPPAEIEDLEHRLDDLYEK